MNLQYGINNNSMRKKLLIIGTACLIAVMIVVSWMIFQAKSNTSQRISEETSQTKLFLTPAGGQFELNSPIETVVTLDAGSNSISGFSTTFEYDASKLDYVSYEKLTTLFDSVTINSSTAGKIILVVEADPTANLPTGNGLAIVKIKFTSKSTVGNATLSFSDTTVIGSTYTQILTSSGVTSTYGIGQVATTQTPTVTSIPSTTINPSSTISPSIPSPSLTQPPRTGANICFPIGDVDENGTVNTGDLNLLRKFLDNEAYLTPVQMNKANLTGSTSSKKPYEEDYNRLKLLLNGEGNRVFPGEPPVCPYMNNVFIGFSDYDVTLNKSILTPTKNTITVYNPEKKNINSLYVSLSFPSDAIRISKLTPLNGYNFSQLSSNNSSFRINGPIGTAEVIKVAEINVVPWTVGYTRDNGELRVNSFNIYDDGVGPSENFRTEGRYAKANYTIIGPETSTTPSPTKTPTQIITPTAINASPPVGGASLKITASIPGIGTSFASDNKNPVETVRRTQVELVGSGNANPINASGNLYFNGSAYSGYVIVPNITKGNYQIKVRFNTTLYKVIPGVYYLSDTQSVDTTPVKLVNGDFNQDKLLDLLDYNIMLACVQKKPACSQAMQENADLNSDGKVAEADYSIFVRQFDVREGD